VPFSSFVRAILSALYDYIRDGAFWNGDPGSIELLCDPAAHRPLSHFPVPRRRVKPIGKHQEQEEITLIFIAELTLDWLSNHLGQL
jgi:hypothetical protein